MKVHVNSATDKSAGVSMHQWGFPGPTVFMPAFEMLVPMDRGQLANSLASRVKHGGQPIVQDGHDCGRQIHDLTLVVPNMLYPLIWPFTSRKTAYAASTVVMQGKATACADVTASFPLTMLTCGDPITSPLGLPITNMHNTVFVGMTGMDIFAGIVGIFCTIAGDIASLIMSIATFSAPEDLAWEAIKAVLEKLALPLSVSGLEKYLWSAVAAVVVGVAQYVDGGCKGPIQISLQPPSPELPGVSVGYDPSTGHVDWKPVYPTPTGASPYPTASSPAPAAPAGSGSNSLGPSDDVWGQPLESP